MNLSLFSFRGSWLFVVLVAVLGTTMIAGSSITQVWAAVLEGTEGPDRIVGTARADLIDSKGGNDDNYGDTVVGEGSGDDIINSGEGNDENWGDTSNTEQEDSILFNLEGSGDDNIISGEGNDENWGDNEIGPGSGNDNIISGE